MKAITLRNLPPDLTKAVRREAERKRTSINKAVISLLESKADIQKKTKVENRITKSWTLWPGHGVKKRRRSSTRRWPLKGPLIPICGSRCGCCSTPPLIPRL